MEKGPLRYFFWYIDVCGPFDVTVRGGYLYFIIFSNDCSWHGYVFLVRHKSETLKKFKEFKCEVEKQIEKILKVF